MRGKGKRKAAPSGSGKIKGVMTPGVLTLTSAAGIFIVNTYDIDTQICTLWNELAGVFQRWKLHWMRVKLTPIRGSNVTGTLSMCIQEDDPSSAPVTTQEVLSQRVCAVTNNTQAVHMLYRPKHNIWFYTGDNVTSDDRWEMPGRLHVASSDFTSAVVPAIVSISFCVSFDLVTIPNTASFLSKTLVPLIKKEAKETPPDIEDLKRQLVKVEQLLLALKTP
jgi:hypothetical protein